MENKFIVAICSSAGGLEPTFSFFDSTPHDKAAYMVLRHVPIDHQSHLQEILAHHSKLKIVEATDGMLIEYDTVNTQAKGMYMTIKNDLLYLSKRSQATCTRIGV